MSIKVTKKEISLVEAYLGSFLVTAFGLYSSGDHQIKKVAWAAAIAVFGPAYLSVKAKVKSFVAKNVSYVGAVNADPATTASNSITK